jgi:protein pelota
VSKLLVLDELLRKNEDIEKLVESAEKAGAEIVIISSEGNPGLRLKNFSGIATLLRWKLSD